MGHGRYCGVLYTGKGLGMVGGVDTLWGMVGWQVVGRGRWGLTHIVGCGMLARGWAW